MSLMAPAETSFSLGSIGQIALTVSDAGRAAELYRDTLGMRFLFQVPNAAFFDCDGVRLMLSQPEKPGDSSGSVIYFKVADIQQAFRTISSRGVVFEAE